MEYQVPDVGLLCPEFVHTLFPSGSNAKRYQQQTKQTYDVLFVHTVASASILC